MIQSPASTVTFLFTDIEGSTLLAAALRERWSTVVEDHHRLLRTAFGAHRGSEMDLAGDGFFYVFPTARDALEATIDAQRALAAHDWPPDGRVRVRMGVHTGEAQTGSAGYVGIEVHRASRVAGAGHGGQVLVSQTTAALVEADPPAGIELMDLGEHNLKDLPRPERLFQVMASGLQPDFPALRTLDTLPNNLPRQLTVFLGRAKETDTARSLLETSPLLTLTGPGGIGKTRLALRLAGDVLERYPDGVWVVELGTITDGDAIADRIATVIGLADRPGVSGPDKLVGHLRTRSTLIILDDCEHLVEACARLADTLLRASPGLRIVATSREAFGIPGETIYRVPSMALPDDDAPPASYLDYEAIALFADRARMAMPGFAIDDRSGPMVARICRSLDGIPLAIELAAARVRTMPLEQIAARLDDRFRLLTGGSRVALQRQQTLRAAMDWSYDLLTAQEQQTLRRLAVFAGSFTLEAAELICSGQDIESYEVVDLLGRLVDKSLVVLDVELGQGRYRLLETIREYGREKLVESGEAAEAQTRHRDWYLELVERAKPDFFRGGDPAEWIWTFDRERANLNAALEWSAADPSTGDVLLRMAAGLWRYWEIRGALAEASSWLARAIESDTGAASEVRATALTGAAVISGLRGDHQASMRYLERCVDAQRDIGNPLAVAAALNNLASMCLQLGDFERARRHYEEAIEQSRSGSDWRGAAFSRMNLASVSEAQGAHEEAFRGFEEAAEMFRAGGDAWGEAHALGQHGAALLAQGDATEAAAILDRALALYRSISDNRGVARILMLLADAAAGRGATSEAIGLHLEGLSTRLELGDKPGTVRALERLAATVAAIDPRQAACLLGTSEALRVEIGTTRSMAGRAEHDQLVASLTASIGAPAFGAAWDGGLSMTVETALDRVARLDEGAVKPLP
jgi:predicted ATPase/class 3 adenylate cyclase